MDELEVELDTAAREMAAEALAKTAKEAKAAPKEAPVSKDTKAKEIVKKQVVVEDVEEDDEEDEELLSNVFKSLAGDKTYVAPKDLLNWDIVLELMGEVSYLAIDIVLPMCLECLFYCKPHSPCPILHLFASLPYLPTYLSVYLSISLSVHFFLARKL
jgi:hypothetical protein